MNNQFLIVTRPSRFVTKFFAAKTALLALSFILLSSPFTEVKAQGYPGIDLEHMGYTSNYAPHLLGTVLSDLLATTPYNVSDEYNNRCIIHCEYASMRSTSVEWAWCLARVLEQCHISREPGGANCMGISVRASLAGDDDGEFIARNVPCP